MSAPDRRRLVDRDNGVVSIRRQCELLGIAYLACTDRSRRPMTTMPR